MQVSNEHPEVQRWGGKGRPYLSVHIHPNEPRKNYMFFSAAAVRKFRLQKGRYLIFDFNKELNRWVFEQTDDPKGFFLSTSSASTVGLRIGNTGLVKMFMETLKYDSYNPLSCDLKKISDKTIEICPMYGKS